MPFECQIYSSNVQWQKENVLSGSCKQQKPVYLSLHRIPASKIQDIIVGNFKKLFYLTPSEYRKHENS